MMAERVFSHIVWILVQNVCMCMHVRVHVCAYAHSRARPFWIKLLPHGREVLQWSIVMLEARLFLAKDKEGMACVGLAAALLLRHIPVAFLPGHC